MAGHSPLIYLARHGETEWSLTGQHTGRADIPLTPKGERDAVVLGERLRQHRFAHAFASPLQRAWRTTVLAGFPEATRDDDLMEWDYGQYEGRRSVEIKAERPDWRLFRDGCPGGESLEQVAVRADRFVQKLRSLEGDVVVFSSGHILRVIAARWLGLDASAGAVLTLKTTSLSIVGYEHGPGTPVIHLWNDLSHLGR